MSLRVVPSRSQALFLSQVCAIALAGTLTLPSQTAPEPSPIPPAIQTRLDRLAADLTRALATGDRIAQVAALRDTGYLYLDDLRQNTRAAEAFDRTLPLARAINDHRDEAMLLLGQAVIDYRKNRYPEGIALALQQLTLAPALKDPEVEARAAIVLGFGYDHENRIPRAVTLATQAHTSIPGIQNPAARLRTLLKLDDLLLALANDGSPQLDLTRAVSSEALLLARQTADPSAEAHALYGLAKTEDLADNPRKALEGYTQALAMLTAQDDQYGMRGLLVDRAVVYKQLNDLPKAVEDLNRRAALLEQNGDRKAATQTRIFAGDMLSDLGLFDEALTYATQGLAEARQSNLRDVEAYALALVGHIDTALGLGQKAIEATDQALAILREIGPENRVADTLRVAGTIQRDLLGNPRKAAEAFTRAAAIYAAQHDRIFETETLISLCRLYGVPTTAAKPLDSPRALASCSQALREARSTENPFAEEEALVGTGEVYAALGDHAKALDFYSRAIPMAVAGKKPQDQSDLFFDLTKEYRQTRPDLAIFFGKQSINLLQQLRGNLQKQDTSLQSSYLNAYEDRYRTLAAILIAQGRLPEAQQVLDLLKQHEFAEYSRGEGLVPSAPVYLTPEEEQAAADYQRTSQTLIADSEAFARLKKLDTRAPAEEAEFQRLSASLSSASKGLNDFYDRLYTLFGRNAQANKQLADVKGTAAIIRQQIARSPHTVALWTLVSRNRLSILVITPTTMVAREVLIAESDLNARVQDLRHALQDPATDPRPIARKVYELVVAPIQADLDQAHAETLVWSLDGVLRYIPMAALYDGKHYLVERYNSVNFTPTASSFLGDKPVFDKMSAVAMGVSMQFDKDLIALPAVAAELHQVVHEPQSPSGGALPGAILLDAAFTEKSMEAKLDGQRQIVHIASHFVSRPGDDRRSYLLLAGKDMRDPGGYHLTVADFRDNQSISLENTDLLTLSACDTGIDRSTSDGREVDGLSATAQTKGAKAVLSSLWKVNDASTGLFMADFYNRWVRGNGSLMKVEAIRQAQLDLLLNRTAPASTPYTHPFFWAPFTLVGNWR